jgi:hypothetical protein
MTAVIYTYPPDYLMAGIAARMLAGQGIHVVLAIDRRDPPFACEFGEVVRTDFDRRGNLNGREFILGHLELMRRHATGSYTIKIDSDTQMINAQRFFDGRTEVAVGIWAAGMDGMQGCCYALRSDALPAMIEAAGRLHPTGHYLEDRTIGELAMSVGPCHLPVWRDGPTLYDIWKQENPPEWYRERHAVVTFPRKDDDARPAIARAMKSFL